MYASKPDQNQFSKQAVQQNKETPKADKLDLANNGKLDWLFFSSLNAHEQPGQTILLEE